MHIMWEYSICWMHILVRIKPLGKGYFTVYSNVTIMFNFGWTKILRNLILQPLEVLSILYKIFVSGWWNTFFIHTKRQIADQLRGRRLLQVIFHTLALKVCWITNTLTHQLQSVFNQFILHVFADCIHRSNLIVLYFYINLLGAIFIVFHNDVLHLFQLSQMFLFLT